MAIGKNFDNSVRFVGSEKKLENGKKFENKKCREISNEKKNIKQNISEEKTKTNKKLRLFNIKTRNFP